MAAAFLCLRISMIWFELTFSSCFLVVFVATGTMPPRKSDPFLLLLILPCCLSILRSAAFQSSDTDSTPARCRVLFMSFVFILWRVATMVIMAAVDPFAQSWATQSWASQACVVVFAATAFSASLDFLYLLAEAHPASAAPVGQVLACCLPFKIEAQEFDFEVVRADQLDHFQFGRFCVVCLIECGGLDIVCRLPCAHVFHNECIQGWLRRDARARCPVCLSRVFNAGESAANAVASM